MGITVHFTYKKAPIQTIEMANAVMPRIESDTGPEVGRSIKIRTPRVKKVKVVKEKIVKKIVKNKKSK